MLLLLKHNRSGHRLSMSTMTRLRLLISYRQLLSAAANQLSMRWMMLISASSWLCRLLLLLLDYFVGGNQRLRSARALWSKPVGEPVALLVLESVHRPLAGVRCVQRQMVLLVRPFCCCS